MTLDDDICYRALTARDARFDGLFFVGVKTTGIYCRPVCTAKTPGRIRCQFFTRPAIAENAGFRPCLRCRPELAPGHAPIDSPRTIAHTVASRIEAGALSHTGSLQDLASDLGISSRQLRRVVQKELGVSPIQLAQTNRLLLAKRLIAETSLSMTQIAFASGFQSIRRFNALFQSHYKLTPSALSRSTSQPAQPDCLRLVLAYRPPIDWDAMLQFLAGRAIPGVESVTGNTYHRTVSIGKHQGWLSVSPALKGNLLTVDIASGLTPILPVILARLKNLFDLDARPDIIAGHLSQDPMLAPWVARHPGLRVPGAFDSFELALRAILGQQVSVRGASTLAGRFAATFGQPIQTPIPGLTHLAPTAQSLSEAHPSALAKLGLPTARAHTIWNLARVVASGQIDLEPGADPLATIAALQELPGIGPWTAHYIAMRALRWPDAFPVGDLALAKASLTTSPKSLERISQPWRPWRAYAAMHLWQSLKPSSHTNT